MKFKKIGFLLLAIIFLTGMNVYAEDSCTYKNQASLNKTASYVKANYEANKNIESTYGQDSDAPDGTTIKVDVVKYSFTFKIYNLTEDIYAVISNNNDAQELTAHYSDTKDGVYTFTSDNQTAVIKYTITIYGNLSGCEGKKLRSVTITKPRYNRYSQYSICKGYENTVAYCNELTTSTSSISFDAISKAVYKYSNNEDEKSKSTQSSNKFLSFIKNNYLYIIIGVVVVGAGITVVIIRRRKAL